MVWNMEQILVHLSGGPASVRCLPAPRSALPWCGAVSPLAARRGFPSPTTPGRQSPLWLCPAKNARGNDRKLSLFSTHQLLCVCSRVWSRGEQWEKPHQSTCAACRLLAKGNPSGPTLSWRRFCCAGCQKRFPTDIRLALRAPLLLSTAAWCRLGHMRMSCFAFLLRWWDAVPSRHRSTSLGKRWVFKQSCFC